MNHRILLFYALVILNCLGGMRSAVYAQLGGCVGEPMSFKPTAPLPGTEYTWDFGEGTSITTLDDSVIHVFSTPGTFTITLTLNHPAGCSQSSTSEIEIHQLSLSSMTMIPPSCPDGTDGAINLSVTGGVPDYSFNWAHGDTIEDPLGLASGEYRVTVIDSLGCALVVADFIEEAEDDIAPVAICNDITIILDNTGNGNIEANDIGGDSFDACGIASISLDRTNFDCTTTGAQTVTLTVLDENSNLSFCSATVFVQDNSPPVALCQDVTVFLDPDSGVSSLSPGELDNGSHDGCALGSSTISIPSLDCSHIGNNSVILTVNDLSGNSASCNSLVTVSDTSAPTLNCPEDLVVSAAPGCSTFVAIPIPTASDNCGVLSLTNDITATVDASAYFNAGISPVTVSATDVNGNVASCIFSVTVGDTINLFTSSVPTACIGTEISFTSVDTGALISLWTFGDGMGSTDESPTHTYSSSGIFTVTLERTEAFTGCVSTYFETIEIFGPVVEEVMVERPCYAGNDGSIDLTIGGAVSLPVSYVWSGPGGYSASSEDLSSLGPGEYSLLLTDASGCSNSWSSILTGPPPITWSSTWTDVSCGALPANGSINITATGGTFSLLYSIDGGGSFSPSSTFINLEAGTYPLMLKDAATACTLPAETLVIHDPGSSISFEHASTAASVSGDDGQLHFSSMAGGAGGPYTYSVDNGSSFVGAVEVDGLAPGPYVLRIQDAAGCISLPQNDTVYGILPLDIVVIRPSCLPDAGPGATLQFVPLAGVPPFTFSWETAGNSDTTDYLEGEPAGLLYLTAADAGYLSVIDTFTIPLAPSFAFVPIPTHISSPGADDGAIEVNVTGSSAPYFYIRDYELIPPLGDEFSSTNLFSSLIPGTHWVAVQDSFSCMEGPFPVPIFEPVAKRIPGTEASSSLKFTSDWVLEAFPNPFSESAVIRFVSPRTGRIILDVWTLEGALVTRLFEGEIQQGKMNEVEFASNELPTGIYMAKLWMDERYVGVVKLVLVR